VFQSCNGTAFRLSVSFISAFRGTSRLRSSLTLLCLFAFLIQSFVVQTHVHAPSEDTSTAASNSQPHTPLGFTASDRDTPKHPAGDGSRTHCPLCEVALHGGGVPLPGYSLSVLVLVAKTVTGVEHITPFSMAAVSYSWRCRGPPLT